MRILRTHNINIIVLFYARSNHKTNTRDPAIYLIPTPISQDVSVAITRCECCIISFYIFFYEGDGSTNVFSASDPIIR